MLNRNRRNTIAQKVEFATVHYVYFMKGYDQVERIKLWQVRLRDHYLFLMLYLYLNKYDNVCVHLFLGHYETDWDPLWHNVAFWP